MKTADNQEAQMIQRILLVVWVVLLVGLFCMIGYILVDGSTAWKARQ
jgi:hypothetical protein